MGVQPTSAATLAAGEEVQHWIWLLRTFSDRCCVTHLNARLLYMVSLASLNSVGANMHVLEKLFPAHACYTCRPTHQFAFFQSMPGFCSR